MKQCPVCGLTVEDREPFCPRCSADLTHVPPLPPQAQPLAPAPPPYYAPRPQPARRPFTWADVATFLGFCASIVGYFGASVFFPGHFCLCPGLKGNGSGLAVAGIVIATPGAAAEADGRPAPGGVPSPGGSPAACGKSVAGRDTLAFCLWQSQWRLFCGNSEKGNSPGPPI